MRYIVYSHVSLLLQFSFVFRFIFSPVGFSKKKKEVKMNSEYESVLVLKSTTASNLFERMTP